MSDLAIKLTPFLVLILKKRLVLANRKSKLIQRFISTIYNHYCYLRAYYWSRKSFFSYSKL